jgi:hypothetical protein
MRFWNRSSRQNRGSLREFTPARGPGRNRRPQLEGLEGRTLLSTYTLSETFVSSGNSRVPAVVETVNNVTTTYPNPRSPFLVNTGTGGNTVNILDTSAGIPVEIIGRGQDTVNVGSGGIVQGILGAVSVENPTSLTTLNIDDSTDLAARSVTLGSTTQPGDSSVWGTITGLAPAVIDYRAAGTAGVHVNTGSVAATFDVQFTSVPTYLNTLCPVPVIPVHDTVNVDNVMGVTAPLHVASSTYLMPVRPGVIVPAPSTTLHIDDPLDLAAGTVTLARTAPAGDSSTWGTITGLAPATIDYRSAGTADAYLNTGGTSPFDLNSALNEIAGYAANGASLKLSNNGISYSMNVPDIGEVDFAGTYNPGTGQWSLSGHVPGPIEIGAGPYLDVDLTNLTVTLTNNGLTADGNATLKALGVLPIANATAHTAINSDGRFVVDVTARAGQLGGYTLSNTTAVLTNMNPNRQLTLTVGTKLNEFGLSVVVLGSIDSQGNFDLKGTGTFNVGGFTPMKAAFELNNGGLTASGDLQVLNWGSAHVTGWIGTNGAFSLTSDEAASLKPLGFSLLSQSQEITFTNSGLTVDGSVSVLNWGSVHLAGRVNGNGAFSLTSDQSVSLKPLGFSLFTQNQGVTLTNSGLAVKGGLSVLNWGSVNVSAAVNSNGTFTLNGSGGLSLLGFATTTANITANQNGLTASLSISVNPLGSIGVSGSVNSNGSFSLTGSNDLGSVTVSNNGVKVKVRGIGGLLGGVGI